MEKTLKVEPKDLEAQVSFCFVLDGHIGDFFKLRQYIVAELKKSRLIFNQFSRNAYFAVHWHDLSPEKQLSIKRAKEKTE
jgi:hypothetical protein